MNSITIRLLAIGSLVTLLVFAQSQPPDVGQGWLPEFNHASKQINALAEATPAEKFSWRPAPGVRSVSEVYMHIALGNYFLLNYLGVKLPPELAAKVKPAAEKSVTAKAEVLQWLKDSQERVREHRGTVDHQKKVKFFGAETNAEGIFLRILVHSHEHMGQSIAYSRMIGVVPPWSQSGSQ